MLHFKGLHQAFDGPQHVCKPCVWRFLIMSKHKIIGIIGTNTAGIAGRSATGTNQGIEKFLQYEVFHVVRAFSLLGE